VVKKIIFLGWLIVFLPAMVVGQDKIDAPVWNVGDKWTFTGDGSIEVVKADPSGYILTFSDRNCLIETQNCSAILFQKASLNRINAIERDKHTKYVMGLSKILDFPLIIGKQWKTGYSGKEKGFGHQVSYDYSEIYKVLGWEDITVQAGKFKSLGVEYKRKAISSSASWANIGEEIINQYWYSPDAKYFVKCKYDKDWMKGNKDISNWELTSFQLKK
jgi:hypothetical protein